METSSKNNNTVSEMFINFFGLRPFQVLCKLQKLI